MSLLAAQRRPTHHAIYPVFTKTPNSIVVIISISPHLPLRGTPLLTRQAFLLPLCQCLSSLVPITRPLADRRDLLAKVIAYRLMPALARVLAVRDKRLQALRAAQRVRRAPRRSPSPSRSAACTTPGVLVPRLLSTLR